MEFIITHDDSYNRLVANEIAREAEEAFCNSKS